MPYIVYISRSIKNMKKISPFILLLIALVLTSCSSFKVIKSWEAETAGSMQNKKILVIGRTADKDIRMAYENALTKKFVAAGYNAISSYSQFPDFNPVAKITEEQKQQIQSILEKNGYNGVVLTALKDYQEQSREVGAEKYETTVFYGGMGYPTAYGGFYNYFYIPGSYSADQVRRDTSGSTITSKLYILETVVYDLELEDGKQLVAWVTASIENPDDSPSVATAYANSVAKGFKIK